MVEPDAPDVFALRATETADAAGRRLVRVEWCIQHVEAKLRTSCGFPLVSPQFDAGAWKGVRLLFAPGEAWVERSLRTGRKQSRRRDSGRESEMLGSLRLKVSEEGCEDSREVAVFVGRSRRAPQTVRLGERTIQGFGLDFDWTRELSGPEQDRLSLVVELREVQ